MNKPEHDCEYHSNPESGKCDTCYEIGDAWGEGYIAGLEKALDIINSWYFDGKDMLKFYITTRIESELEKAKCEKCDIRTFVEKT